MCNGEKSLTEAPFLSAHELHRGTLTPWHCLPFLLGKETGRTLPSSIPSTHTISILRGPTAATASRDASKVSGQVRGPTSTEEEKVAPDK